MNPHKLWSRLADVLGKRSGAVLAGALVLSVLLAAGTTRLTFATGQDSYLNSWSQVAVNNRQYQKLFGGQAMITVFTAQPGHQITELFNAANRRKLTALGAKLDATPGVRSAATPLTAMDWNQSLVAPAPGSTDPTSSVAGQILLSAANRETDPAKRQLRLADATTTVTRLGGRRSPHLRQPRLGDVPAGGQPGQRPRGHPALLPDPARAWLPPTPTPVGPRWWCAWTATRPPNRRARPPWR